MEKIRAAVFNDVNRIDIEEIDMPKIHSNEVLVKLKTCAICTWEQRVFTGVNKVQFPFIGGHEEAGIITQIGDNVDKKLWNVGDRVVVGLLTSCGECENCRTGREGSCTNFSYERQVGGLSISGMGGFSEYLAVPITKLFPISDNLSYEQAALTEPLSCVVHSIDLADIQLGDVVVVTGVGIMGAFHAVLARQKGARVIINEPNSTRRQFMQKLGFEEFIDPSEQDPVEEIHKMTNGYGADIVFNTVGVSKFAHQSVKMAAIRGKVILYSSYHPDDPIAISPNTLHRSMTKLMGSANSDTKDFFKAMALLNNGIVDVQPFISGFTTFEDINEGMKKAINPDSYRVILKMNQE